MSANSVAVNRRDITRFPSVEVRPLPPELSAAAWALWHYELDMQFTGSLREAEAEMLAAMPIVEGHENNLRRMVKALVDDIRQDADPAIENRYQLRLSNAYTNLEGMLPQSHLSRIAVIPVSEEYSYHADARFEIADALSKQIDALKNEHFTFVASPGAEGESSDPEDEFLNLRTPLTAEQLAKYRIIARMIAQACVDVANQGLEAQAGLAGALNAIRGAAVRLLGNVTTYQKQVDKLPSVDSTTAKNDNTPKIIESARAVRAGAIDLEKGIKSQMGNSGLSAVMHQTLRSGLQQLQQIKAESGIKPRVQLVLQKRMDVPLARTVQTVKQTIQTALNVTSHIVSKAAPSSKSTASVGSTAQKVATITAKSPTAASTTAKAVSGMTAKSAIIIDFKQAAESIRSNRTALSRVSPQVKISLVDGAKPQSTPKAESQPKPAAEVRADVVAKPEISSKPVELKTQVDSKSQSIPVEKPQTQGKADIKVGDTLGKAEVVQPQTKADAGKQTAPQREVKPSEPSRVEARSETPMVEGLQTETRSEKAKPTSRYEELKTEAPRAETPRAETPRAETPRAEAPRAETPRAEAPRAETPRAEAPRAETPRAEAPRAETPRAEAPRAETPRAETPRAEAPRAEASTTNAFSNAFQQPQANDPNGEIRKGFAETAKTMGCPASGGGACRCAERTANMKSGIHAASFDDFTNG